MSDKAPLLPIKLNDLALAGTMLTRLPIPVGQEDDPDRGAKAAWAYPLIGAIIGVLLWVFLSVILWIGTPETIACMLSLLFLVMLTGGLHEDGIADFADGLGAMDRQRALEIMKDSRIGAFGVIALGLALIGRWSGLLELSFDHYAGAFIAVATASRLPMVFGMAFVPNARGAGLSHSVGSVPLWALAIALGTTMAICLLVFGLGGILVMGWALIGGGACLYFAWRRLGGQTGDVLGASQICAEIAGFAAAIAYLS